LREWVVFKALKPFLQEVSAVLSRSRTPRLAAALAYYSLFSLAPMLFIALWVASLFLKDPSQYSQLYSRIAGVLGTDTADLLRSAVTSFAENQYGGNLLVTLVWLGALLFASTGLFSSLKDALNTIWEIPLAGENPILQIIKGRILAFLLVLGAGFLFVLAAFANLITSYIASIFPFERSLNVINNMVVIILAFLSIALLYKILPDIRVRWRDVWIGALISSILILIGSRLMGIYLSYSKLGSAFQAAGALVVLLVSVYYMMQMFLFGAVITRVYAQIYGSKSQVPQISDQME